MFAFRTIVTLYFALNFTPVLAGPLEDANAAKRRNDCAMAVSIYQALAAKGVAEAYKRLGYFKAPTSLFRSDGYCCWPRQTTQVEIDQLVTELSGIIQPKKKRVKKETMLPKTKL